MVQSRKLSAVAVPNSTRRVVGEERFQQIVASLDQRERITGDKDQEIPFAGETKEQFIRACKTAYPVIKKTYEGINDLGRILGEVRTRLKPLGVYYAWLAFINLPRRTAQNYVQVYDRYREHLPEFADLGIRKLLMAGVRLDILVFCSMMDVWPREHEFTVRALCIR
jgi:hypothetical protein